MPQKKYKVLAFLARQHGLNGLEHLLQNPNYEIVSVVTHRRNPKSEDPERQERKDFCEFQRLTTEHGIPLHYVDTKKEALLLEEQVAAWDFDLIASISWRRLIPEQYLKETTVTDGKRLYVYFGMVGLYCYDLDGNLIWEKDLGAYPTKGDWGTSTSPVLYKKVLYLQFDNEEKLENGFNYSR